MESGFSVYVALPECEGRDMLASSQRRLLAIVPVRETAEWLRQTVRADLERVAEIGPCQWSMERPPDPQMTRVYAALGLARNLAPPAILTALRALADDHQQAMALAVVFRALNQPQRGIEPSPAAQTMIDYGRSQMMKLFDLRQPFEPALLWAYLAGCLQGAAETLQEVEDGPDPEEDKIEEGERVHPNVLRRLFGEPPQYT